jgi:transcriptional regulator with XRE-family HTH domain
MQNTFNRCMFFPHLAHTFRVPNPVTAYLPNEGLPKLLYKRRKALGLNKRQVAEMLGVHRDMIGLWESSTHQPRVKYLPAIIRFLGDASWLSGANPSERLKRFRAVKGWSQERLAKWLGQNERHIRRLEDGEDYSLDQGAEIEAAICARIESGDRAGKI